jgi:hypothetical protein
LELTLREGFEVFPTLLVPDGAFMIDRRMGVYGHPLEIQALFYGMLVSAIDLLRDTPDVPRADRARRQARQHAAQLPATVLLARPGAAERDPPLPHRGVRQRQRQHAEHLPGIHPGMGHRLAAGARRLSGGQPGPGRMDFRFFALGNLLAILFGITSPHEAHAIMRLYQERWDDLVGCMPAKLVYPAVAGKEWMFMTGSDPKNVPGPITTAATGRCCSGPSSPPP